MHHKYINNQPCFNGSLRRYRFYHYQRFMTWLWSYDSSSSHAKGTKSILFLTHIRNEVDLVPLPCEDDDSLDVCALTGSDSPTG